MREAHSATTEHTRIDTVLAQVLPQDDAMLMSIRTLVVAINAQLLRRAKL